MLLQNVERFRSHQEKEKIPEKICHGLVEVKALAKLSNKVGSNIQHCSTKQVTGASWC